MIMKIIFSFLLLTFFSTLSFAQKAEEAVPFLIPGKGWGEVQVGAKRTTIETVIGQGKNRSKYDDVYFVDYPEKGVQISYTNNTDEAFSIFFYNNQKRYENFVTPPIKTEKGITWSSSAKDVIKAYGKPLREFGDESGKNSWQRLEYEKTDFLFENGKLSRIGIHAEICTLCPK
jgi:hypothetical protein